MLTMIRRLFSAYSSRPVARREFTPVHVPIHSEHHAW